MQGRAALHRMVQGAARALMRLNISEAKETWTDLG